MKARSEQERGPSIVDGRARLGAVKTPHVVRPRLRRADGLDRAEDEPRSALVDRRHGLWRPDFVSALLRAHDSTLPACDAPSIVVTIGRETRVFHAFITAASVRLDAPSTVTLYVSTVTDVAGFAADDLAIEPGRSELSARLVLVDAMELTWQRARCREAGHRLVPADAGLVGPPTLQRWLWRRLQTPDVSGST